MRVKRLWIAFAVLMVFDCVLDDSGAFKAALRAVSALVLGVVGLPCTVVAYSPLVAFGAV